VGNIFKLGTDFTVPLGANYLDENGKERPVVMGSYGIGSGRLLACVAEEHHDDKGLIWPITIAPYEVHLMSLRGGAKESEVLYEKLQSAGIDVFYDDREETPGVKFNDADLIGLPIRLTVSERSLKEGGVEFKLRSETDRRNVSMKLVVQETVQTIEKLLAAINEKVVTVPFEG
jgi:prolyl-tRNA synthetase